MTGRTSYDVADIVRLNRIELETIQPLNAVQGRALSAIAICRTSALGGFVLKCPNGDWAADPSYCSCRNRNCPKCQALDQERWLGKRAEALVPIPHFHGVFTLPAELRPLGRLHPREIYDALFKSAGAALMEMAESRLGIKLGLTLVLHTWTRALLYHPHAHILITSGGLTLDGKAFKQIRKKVLLHTRPLAELFKGKMMDALRTLRGQGVITMSDGAFGTLMATLKDLKWVIYLKRNFDSPRAVLSYLARYTHRVGIANSRLLEVTKDKVTFRSKDGRTVTLRPVDFLRRFVQHILPDRFKKIRHMGLYASPKALAKAKSLLPPLPEPVNPPPTWEEVLLLVTGQDETRCPICGAALRKDLIPRNIPNSRRARSPDIRLSA
jgi:hypothetical protein